MRRVILSIILVMSLFNFSTTAHAEVREGISCGKVGTTKVISDKKYTCVKIGLRLVWNNRVQTTKVASTPTVAYPAAPTTFDDLVANYKGISYAAWSKSSIQIRGAHDVAPTFREVTGPHTTLVFKNPTSAFDLIARLYSGFKSSSDSTVMHFGYDDRDWAQEQMKQMQPNSTYQWVTNTACGTRPTCWGGGVFTGDQGNVLMVLTTEVADANHTSGTLEAHEYTHTIQQNQMGNKTQPWPPTWYTEGQAEFSQNAAIYYQSFDLYTSNRKLVSASLFTDTDITSSWIQDFFVVNQPEFWFSTYSSWYQYDLGGMLIEALTALKGPASTMELWKLSGAGSTFSQAFEKIYGTSFEKALPSISKAIALEIGHG